MRIKLLTLFSFFIIWLGFAGIKFTFLHIFFACWAPLLTFYIYYKMQDSSLRVRRHCERSEAISGGATDITPGLLRLPRHLGWLAMTVSSITYLLWLIKEIILSSIAVSKIIWRKNLAIIPSIAPIISVQDTDIGRVVYANSITLTPGTVTLSLEGNKLLVHALDISFMEGLQEGTMDRQVKGCMRG